MKLLNYFLMFIFFISSNIYAGYFYYKTDDVAEYDGDKNLTFKYYEDIDNGSVKFFYKNIELPLKSKNKLEYTRASLDNALEKKNIICVELLQDRNGPGQNTRNIYKIYNKSYVKAFTTKNYKVTCESELKKVR